MSRPSVSCSGRYCLTFAIRSGVVRAGLVQPEHRRVAGRAGAGDGQLDPVADRDVLGLAGAEDVAGLRPPAPGRRCRPCRPGGPCRRSAISKVLSWLPYSSAFCAIRPTFGTEPMVAGSKAPLRAAVVEDDLVDPRRSCCPAGPRGCRPPAPSGPHMWPEVRIMAGIEASTMTSHGTCRLVMPLSESTIASAGPSASSASKDALIASPSGSASRPLRMPPRPSFGVRPAGGERLAVLREGLREEGAHHVAEDDRVGDLHHRGLQVHREQHALGLGAGDLRGEELAQRGDAHDGGVDDLAGEHRDGLAQHGGGAVVADQLDAQRAGLGRSPRTSRWSGSRSAPMVATLVFESADQAPIRCGWVLA